MLICEISFRKELLQTRRPELTRVILTAPGLVFTAFSRCFCVLEMRTTLFLLHAIACCWLVSATLSKTDAKKPHKAEAEVSELRILR